MTEKKRKIVITDFEHRFVVKALAQFRNEFLETEKPTEDINKLSVFTEITASLRMLAF